MSGTSEEENGFEDEEPRARNGCSTCCYPSTSSCCCQTSRGTHNEKKSIEFPGNFHKELFGVQREAGGPLEMTQTNR